MQAELLEKLERDGYRARVVSSSRVDEIRENIEGRLKEGSLKREVYEAYKRSLEASPPADLPGHRSLIVLARPDPQVRFTFNLDGRRVYALVPPTYIHARAKEEEARNAVKEALRPAAHRAVSALLPRKLLAVRSGLAEYGKNNITYVRGMGSFHRITALYTDMPCEDEAWQEPVMLERCLKCSICASRCPSGAIDPERFLLHAERCITFHNEKPNDVPFPEWVKPSWHNCLVGCLVCQRVCPQDRDVIDWTEEGAEFTEEETRFILDFEPAGLELWAEDGPRVPDSVPARLAEKLADSDLAGLLDVMPRNLRALCRASGEVDAV